MLRLLDETEQELERVVPRKNQADVQADLRAKQDTRTELKRATDDILSKMKELVDTLNSVAGKEQQAALESEV